MVRTPARALPRLQGIVTILRRHVAQQQLVLALCIHNQPARKTTAPQRSPSDAPMLVHCPRSFVSVALCQDAPIR